MSNQNQNKRNRNNHRRREQHVEHPMEPVGPIRSSCDDCPAQTECDGLQAAATLGMPIISEQEILMGILTRTKMPFLFTPADGIEECTVISIPLGDDGDENAPDMVFFFDGYGRCIETALA